MTRQDFIRNMREYGYTVIISNPPPCFVVKKEGTDDGIEWDIQNSNCPQDLDNFTDDEFRFYLGMQRLHEAGVV